MSKKLGIMEFQSKLPLNKRLDLMRQNIEAGKQMEFQNSEESRRSIENQLIEKESIATYSRAEFIAKNQNIPLVDALDIAQKELSVRK
jgi:actin-related protein